MARIFPSRRVLTVDIIRYLFNFKNYESFFSFIKLYSCLIVAFTFTQRAALLQPGLTCTVKLSVLICTGNIPSSLPLNLINRVHPYSTSSIPATPYSTSPFSTIFYPLFYFSTTYLSIIHPPTIHILTATILPKIPGQYCKAITHVLAMNLSNSCM